MARGYYDGGTFTTTECKVGYWEWGIRYYVTEVDCGPEPVIDDPPHPYPFGAEDQHRHQDQAGLRLKCQQRHAGRQPKGYPVWRWCR